MMILEKDRLIFNSGRTVRAYAGVVGISNDLEMITGGYDDQLEDEGELTDEEKIELADYMIAKWAEFKASI